MVRSLGGREDRHHLGDREHGLDLPRPPPPHHVHPGRQRGERRRLRHQRRRPALLERRSDDAHAHAGRPHHDAGRGDDITGKTALDYSRSVWAEDDLGIGGFERVIGPNGQAQYWARDIPDACRILLKHYDHTYAVPGERFPRRAVTTDPIDRDVCTSPHGGDDPEAFAFVGEIFSDATNPGRKRPFEIRKVMAAAADQDHPPLERWAGMRDAENGVVWDAHIGGWPVCLLGFESRPVKRIGFVATDGPENWTSGTLFPLASKKIARAINSASGNRPLVVLANLSGFDGSPESMRKVQLEYGAEIGRAVTNFLGPIVFTVVSRYHGGAFVVFSKTLNDNMEVAALEGTYASVIGGAPAAAVVFSREVDQRTKKDPRIVELEKEIAAAPDSRKRKLRMASPTSSRRFGRRSSARWPTSSTASTASSGRSPSAPSTGSCRRPSCGRTSSTPSNGAWRRS